VRNFLDGNAGIEAAVRRYVADVKGGLFRTMRCTASAGIVMQ